ncbi:hypothetical protein [Bacillus cereus group sp. BfR-BA-01313]|uniref:hypothetical protein n=1 Tax=Bacillus cereus group sp. BfR-BA-01313 TaxID=2920290 RepID=UPI001F58DE47
MKPHYIFSIGAKEALTMNEMVSVINHISREFPKPVETVTVRDLVLQVSYYENIIFTRLPQEKEDKKSIQDFIGGKTNGKRN